jgi:hypothetical protein
MPKTTVADIVGTTKAQETALRWLIEHGGDGLFDHNGVLLAAGEIAPHTRATWNALADLGLVQFYKPAGSRRGRLRATERGREVT